MSGPVEQIVALLERIAAALEKIANTGEPVVAETLNRTEFPWCRTSVRCRKNLRSAVEKDEFGHFKGRAWPLCCEDLMEIGFQRLLEDVYVRNWGRKSAEEIIPLMAECGFSDWSTT